MAKSKERQVLGHPAMKGIKINLFHLTAGCVFCIKSKNICASLLVMIAAFSACAGPIQHLFPPGENEPSKSVYVVSNGWHASIVVRQDEIPGDLWPEKEDFPDATYLEIGWGDRDYYPAEGFHLGYAIKALFWPTPSVLHIAGFSDPIERYFPESEIIEIKLSYRGFERLCDYIHDSYERKGTGKTIPLEPGLYGNSLFYPSRETYHLFKTSNVWTAKVLRSAGYPIVPFFAITADNVAFQARKFGKVIQSRRKANGA